MSGKYTGWFLWLLLLVLCADIATLESIPDAHASNTNNPTDITIGVLAHRGEGKARQMWEPTARYLEKEISGYRFMLRPLTLEKMWEAVEKDELDFILTNTGNYVDLEANFDITRVATLKNMRNGKPYTSFGAVIFVRADRQDIKRLADLNGKSFAAVSKEAFGGFQMAWKVLKDAGIDPFDDLSSIEFMGFPQDDIVKNVRDGKVDAGTVRTDTLERMASRGDIDLEDFRILNPQVSPGFPFTHSTRLYPEWPFARARNTADEFATRVVIALLKLSPDDPPSKAGLNAGWTVPLSYQSVHELFRDLKIGFYAQTGKFTLTQVIRQYRYWLILIASGLLLAVYHYIRVERLVTVRTSELYSTNQALEKEIVEHTRSEQEAHIYRDHMQLLMDSTAEAILGVDKEGVCTFANHNCVRLIGYQHEKEIHGKRLQDILFITSVNEVEIRPQDTSLISAIQPGEKWHSDSEICHRLDDTSFPVEYWVHSIENAGVNEGYVITFIDISRRKKIDAELTRHREQLSELVEARTVELRNSNEELQNSIARLREMQTQLVQAEKMASLGSLVAGFSHEINTPLGIGVTSASNIEEELHKLHGLYIGGEMKRSELEKFIDHTRLACDILMRNLRRAADLIRSFKQVAVDQSSDEWRTFNIQEYVDEVLLSLKPRFKQTAVRIENFCDPDLSIYSHPGAIYQILSNLTINALIYAFDDSQKGVIHIKAKRDGNSIMMEVGDNGKGIPNKHQSKIFDPFFTTRRGSGGSGLGLNIVYNLVTGTLKGRISFASSSLDGTIFRIAFPYETEKVTT
ncbi:MAG: PhnD/SsuA/transferrin family substrate-binding protein [Arenicellales bacterium]